MSTLPPVRDGAIRPNSRRCVNCSLLLRPNLRRFIVEELNEQMLSLLRSWITPTATSSDDILCNECYALLQERVLLNETQPQEDLHPVFGHQNVCFGCGISIATRKTRTVSLECAQRNIILRWTPAHQVAYLEKICCACWIAATRQVQREALHDHSRETENMSEEMAVDNSNVQIIERHNMSSSIDAGNIALDLPASVIPEPPPLPIQVEVPQRHQNFLPAPKINSLKYKRVAATSRHCIFTGCENIERLLVPGSIKEVVLTQLKIYIPFNARVCQYHLQNNEWDQLDAPYSDFTGFQVDDIFTKLENASQRQLDFNNIDSIDPHLCHYWLGMTAAEFNEVLNSIPSLNDYVSKPSLALSIYLIKLRTGESNQRLATLFNISRSTLERKMSKARDYLYREFVPRHLGVNHMSIQDVALRNRIIPEGLFGNAGMPLNSKPAIVICDGTYVYVQSSSNYRFQKQTYSLHKYANLVKPFLFVCCDGYILDCIGPYEATQNDSSIMSALFENENGPMRTFFREGDVFILDRGFRDVLPVLQNYNYKTHMPESLLENEHQLTTEQANRSTCVTMCRWVVEVVNGRVKRDFKLFRQEYFNRASLHLMTDFKIACSLLNKFHLLIEDSPNAVEYLNIARARLNTRNILSEFVQRENINRRRTIFQRIDSSAPHLDSFPRLSLTDLRRFALGSYQLKQARSYYGEHIRESGTYSVEISDEIEEDLPLILGQDNYLIRARIKSRHVSGKTYYSYLLINKNSNMANPLDRIMAYYCNCLVGKRTVGCCAHTMTVLWYLSWGRYNDVRAPAQFLDDIFYN